MDYTQCISMKGRELKRIRRRLMLTQVRLAEQLGVTSNTVARWERGEVLIREPIRRLIQFLASQKKKGGRGHGSKKIKIG